MLRGQRASNSADLNDVVVVLEEIGPRASETEDRVTYVDATREEFRKHYAELVVGTFMESEKKTDDCLCCSAHSPRTLNSFRLGLGLCLCLCLCLRRCRSIHLTTC